mmetsp:Transcript_6819/g.15802  ORF Transcript_6819/g.15802 Transcript_6819/m.15802 type:complete len:713 (-) Transcript_6819:197-2335(-)
MLPKHGSEGMDSETGGWDRLWSAQSERVAEMQRMLQSACRDAASLTDLTSTSVSVPGPEETYQSRPSGPRHFGVQGQASPASPALQTATEQQHQACQAPLQQSSAQQPMPADEGAGSYPPEPSAWQRAEGPCQNPSKEVPQAVVHHEEITNVSNEVLRLRLLKSQHEELKAHLSRADAQLRRLSPHAVFQLRSYLEKNFREPGLAAQVQDSIVRLMQSLFAVFKMEVPSLTAEALLSGARKLFRDPHSFTSKLCSMPTFSSEEAKRLAPFLTSGSQFRRVREKEVNECYEALHGWLSAFYTYSSVSDQVSVTLQQLEKQEWLLRRLNNQAFEAEETVASAANAQQTSPPLCGAVGGPPVQAWTSATAATHASRAGPAGSSKSTSSARVTASPLSRSRRALQGFAPATALKPALGRVRATTTSSFQESEGPQSRSQSPVQASRMGGARPRAVFSVAFGGPPMVSARSTGANSPHGRPTGARPRAETTAGVIAGTSSTQGLARVHSDKALSRSPRTAGRQNSRSPSPGTGRVSPSVPRRFPQSQVPKTRRDGRISPSASEGVIPAAQRMVSAPMELASRTVAVRTTKTAPLSSARVSSTRHSAAAPPGRSAHISCAGAGKPVACRQGSPDKGGGAPRDASVVDSTPRGMSHRRQLDPRAAKDEDSAREESDGEGPSRKLSEKQYEALVRCAQQVVALSGAGSGLLPGPPKAHGA